MLFCHNQQVPNPRNSQLYGQRKHNDERVDEEMKSLCKEEIGWQWGVSAGLVGTEGVLFRVSLPPPLFFVSSFEMWGGELGVTGLCSYLSKEVH